MSVIAVIPARYGSSRFPGKPLHKIAGLEMVERVRRLAQSAANIDQVIVFNQMNGGFRPSIKKHRHSSEFVLFPERPL